jgi:hypothetical protein
MGRDTKLTPEMIDKAYQLIKAPHYAQTVYQALGVSHTTYYTWLKKGEAWKEGDDPLYLEFLESIKKGEAEGEQELLGIIKTAAKRNWTAAAWMLERMHPDRYGRKEQIDLDGKLTVTSEINLLPEETTD